METLGFIGLGVMGKPIAGNLIAAGHEVHLFSRSGVASELIAAGGINSESIAELTRNAGIVFIMVPDTPDVEAVLSGDSGILEHLSPGQILVDLSSISPLATREIAESVQQKGGMYLDAPVSGGEVGAVAGSLSIMAGGPESAFNAVKPLFDIIGENITHVGANGDGQLAKLANQIIVGLTLEAVAEALVFVEKAGANPERVRQALMGGFASSRVLELHGERMTSRNFAPGFRTSLHQKDLATALNTAQHIGAALPGTALTQQLFNTVRARSESDNDHSAIVKALEVMSIAR